LDESTISWVEETALIHSRSIHTECGRFRIFLERVWDDSQEKIVFLCMNPSIADHLQSDLTVTNCMNLAVQWRYGGVIVINLYPLYSTDPAGLTGHIGADKKNEYMVRATMKAASRIYLACGNKHLPKLRQLLSPIADDVRNNLYCIKKNKGGGFKHPSRLPFNRVGKDGMIERIEYRRDIAVDYNKDIQGS
jgi:hypothetical protein